VGRVLVADDEPAFADFVRRVLAGRGHTVTIVEDGAAALRALDMARYDLVLADIRMPVMDGITLALQVADAHPDTGVVLVTGHAEEAARARGMEAIVARVLSKPLMPEDILAVVDEVVPPPG